jgi:hypothetical protein
MGKAEDLEIEVKRLRDEKSRRDDEWRESVTCKLENIALTQTEHREETTILFTGIQKELAKLSDDQHKTNVLLTGNGDAEKGMIVRLDRVEQQHKTLSSWFYILLPVSVTGLGAAVWSWLTGQPNKP